MAIVRSMCRFRCFDLAMIFLSFSFRLGAQNAGNYVFSARG